MITMKVKSLVWNCAAVLCITVFLSCGSSKKAVEQRYSRADELKEKLGEYTQAGWAIHGSTRTLQGKLIEHYDKLDANPDLYEVIGTSTGCRSVTVCRASALNAACVDFAVKMGQSLKGKTMRDMGIDEGTEVPTEYNKFQEACISKFQTEIKGELQESLALIKNNGSNNEYQMFFIVDKESAKKKRTQAIKDALKESKLNQEYAHAVEKFINDDVE